MVQTSGAFDIATRWIMPQKSLQKFKVYFYTNGPGVRITRPRHNTYLSKIHSIDHRAWIGLNSFPVYMRTSFSAANIADSFQFLNQYWILYIQKMCTLIQVFTANGANSSTSESDRIPPPVMHKRQGTGIQVYIFIKSNFTSEVAGYKCGNIMHMLMGRVGNITIFQAVICIDRKV